MSDTFVLKDLGDRGEGGCGVYDVCGNKIGFVNSWEVSSSDSLRVVRSMNGDIMHLPEYRIWTARCTFQFSQWPEGTYDPTSPDRAYLFDSPKASLLLPKGRKLTLLND